MNLCLRRAALASALLLAGTACGLLDRSEDEQALASGRIDDRVRVVSEEGPFDPRAAVDDFDNPLSTGPEDPNKEPPPASREAQAEESEAHSERRQKEAAAQSADEQPGDDASAKAEVAHNPPPEPVPDREKAAWTAVDVLLDGVLVAALALVVALLVVFASSHRKTAAAVALAAVALVGYLWLQAG